MNALDLIWIVPLAFLASVGAGALLARWVR